MTSRLHERVRFSHWPRHSPERHIARLPLINIPEEGTAVPRPFRPWAATFARCNSDTRIVSWQNYALFKWFWTSCIFTESCGCGWAANKTYCVTEGLLWSHQRRQWHTAMFLSTAYHPVTGITYANQSYHLPLEFIYAATSAHDFSDRQFE